MFFIDVSVFENKHKLPNNKNCLRVVSNKIFRLTIDCMDYWQFCQNVMSISRLSGFIMLDITLSRTKKLFSSKNS